MLHGKFRSLVGVTKKAASLTQPFCIKCDSQLEIILLTP